MTATATAATRKYATARDPRAVSWAGARSGGANLQSEGELGVEKVLHTVMDRAVDGRVDAVDAICLGMAGVDRDPDLAVIRGIMRRIGARARTVVVNDALVALVAGGGGAPRLAILRGTGSIAYGRNARDQAARAGGWGHVLGDEGSGYWIGREGLRGGGRGARRRRPPPRGGGGVVQQARDEGDEVATQILEQAAHELVRAARSVAERLCLSNEAFTFVLAGGVFTGVPWLGGGVRR